MVSNNALLGPSVYLRRRRNLNQASKFAHKLHPLLTRNDETSAKAVIRTNHLSSIPIPARLMNEWNVTKLQQNGGVAAASKNVTKKEQQPSLQQDLGTPLRDTVHGAATSSGGGFSIRTMDCCSLTIQLEKRRVAQLETIHLDVVGTSISGVQGDNLMME